VSALEAATGIGMSSLQGSTRPERTASQQCVFDSAMKDGDDDEENADVIQKAMRGKSARGQTAVLRAEKAEASRKATADVLSHHISASTKFQAVYRGHRARSTQRGLGPLPNDDDGRRRDVSAESNSNSEPEEED
jgi:hypothetical protein